MIIIIHTHWLKSEKLRKLMRSWCFDDWRFFCEIKLKCQRINEEKKLFHTQVGHNKKYPIEKTSFIINSIITWINYKISKEQRKIQIYSCLAIYLLNLVMPVFFSNLYLNAKQLLFVRSNLKSPRESCLFLY